MPSGTGDSNSGEGEAGGRLNTTFSGSALTEPCNDGERGTGDNVKSAGDNPAARNPSLADLSNSSTSIITSSKLGGGCSLAPANRCSCALISSITASLDSPIAASCCPNLS